MLDRLLEVAIDSQKANTASFGGRRDGDGAAEKATVTLYLN